MACYVHDVPGRLRVKTLAVKNDSVRAWQVRSCLEGINGVLETGVSTITGSVVVKYDTRLLNSTIILNILRDQGHIQHAYPLANNKAIPGAHPAQKVADTLVTKLIEVIVERSAAALIAAVI